MAAWAFSARNRKEILRDPWTLVFGIGFPLILLMIMSMVEKSLPTEMFKAHKFAPGMAVFSLSFIALFSGMLIAKDRSSSFLMRLFASPLSAPDYIIGYGLPLLPVAILQSTVCLVAAFLVGLPVSLNALVAVVALIPSAVLFIGLGLLLGSTFTDKQVAGVGSLLVNLAALLAGTWFDLEMIGGALRTISYALPFAHGVDAARAALAGDFASILPHLWWVVGYAAIIFTAAVIVFRNRLRSGST